MRSLWVIEPGRRACVGGEGGFFVSLLGEGCASASNRGTDHGRRDQSRCRLKVLGQLIDKCRRCIRWQVNSRFVWIKHLNFESQCRHRNLFARIEHGKCRRGIAFRAVWFDDRCFNCRTSFEHPVPSDFARFARLACVVASVAQAVQN